MAPDSKLPPQATVTLSHAEAAFSYWQARWLYEDVICDGLRAGASVVSIGEGTGEYMAVLAQRHPHLKFLGLDLDPVRVATATALTEKLRLSNAQFIVGDSSKIELPDSSADFVYCRNTFHVITDKQAALKEIGRIANGPVNFSAIPNHPYAAIILRLKAARHSIHNPGHYRHASQAYRVTEDYLCSIGSFRSAFWFLRLIKAAFPRTKMIGTYVGCTDLQRLARWPFLGTHVGFDAWVA